MSPIAAIDHLVTAEELLEHPEWEHCELIDGKVISLSPPNARHGKCSHTISRLLGNFVDARKCGEVLVEAGFILCRKPDTVRAPDVMYLSNARMPPGGIPNEYLPVPPDLAVEVVSPTDRSSDVTEKVASFLAAGVKVVWVVDPASRSAQVHRVGQPVVALTEDGALTASDLLPGFSLPLKDIFQF